MKLSDRQKKIIEIVKISEPISGENIAAKLGLARATLRNDLAILTMTGVLDARPKLGYFYSGQSFNPLLFDDLFSQKVESIMGKPVFIYESLPLTEAIAELFLNDVGSLIVLNDKNELAGIISRKDLLRFAISDGKDRNYPAAMIMTRGPKLVTIFPDETLLEAGYEIMKNEVDMLPVVSRENPQNIVGRISKTNLTNFFIEKGLKDLEEQK